MLPNDGLAFESVAMAAFEKSCRRRGHAGSSESDPKLPPAVRMVSFTPDVGRIDDRPPLLDPLPCDMRGVTGSNEVLSERGAENQHTRTGHHSALFNFSIWMQPATEVRDPLRILVAEIVAARYALSVSARLGHEDRCAVASPRLNHWPRLSHAHGGNHHYRDNRDHSEDGSLHCCSSRTRAFN
jgi:hypothetical protein